MPSDPTPGIVPKLLTSKQAVMRHSTITLTMDTYGHLFPGQEAETVARLLQMLADTPEAMRATGTDDAAAQRRAHQGQQLGGKLRRPPARKRRARDSNGFRKPQ